jgi:hypothetical protein
VLGQQNLLLQLRRLRSKCIVFWLVRNGTNARVLERKSTIGLKTIFSFVPRHLRRSLCCVSWRLRPPRSGSSLRHCLCLRPGEVTKNQIRPLDS